LLLNPEGAAISPFSAWFLLQGIETLAVRLDRIASNAEPRKSGQCTPSPNEAFDISICGRQPRR
jgi:hypothetical protein